VQQAEEETASEECEEGDKKVEKIFRIGTELRLHYIT
jgi:hypothetical protein